MSVSGDTPTVGLSIPPLPQPIASGTVVAHALPAEMAVASYATEDGRKSLRLVAELFAKNEMTPDAHRGKIGNCMIGCEIAMRNNESPLVVLQNLNIIHNKPSWSAQYLIGKVNTCGRFAPLEFEFEGDERTDKWTCWAESLSFKTGKVIRGPKVTYKMAKEEGWIDKKGSKWKTMPELMMIYRAGTFFQRTYAPELSLGFLSSEEVLDIGASRASSEASTRQLSNLILGREVQPQLPSAEARTPEAAILEPETPEAELPEEEVAGTIDPADVPGAIDPSAGEPDLDTERLNVCARLLAAGVPIAAAELAWGVNKLDWNETALQDLNDACQRIESGMATIEEIFG